MAEKRYTLSSCAHAVCYFGLAACILSLLHAHSRTHACTYAHARTRAHTRIRKHTCARIGMQALSHSRTITSFFKYVYAHGLDLAACFRRFPMCRFLVLHACTHACTQTHAHARTHTQMHTHSILLIASANFVHRRIITNAHACTQAHNYTQAHTHARTQARMQARTQGHTRVH